MSERKTMGQLMEEMRLKAGAQNYHGHEYMDLERFAEDTRHMIKVEFYKKIKELEARLQPTAPDKRIVLNSFIMSGTKSADLRQWWNMSKLEREAKNVLCLDNDDCIDVMFRKIVGSVAKRAAAE